MFVMRIPDSFGDFALEVDMKRCLVFVALLVAMVVSSLVGTVVPMFFHKLKVDPAVASGPLITTINDLVAVVTYYGISKILLIDLLHLA